MISTSYDPRAIANLIILLANEREVKVTNLSVQKLLYFAHAFSLAKYDRPLVRGVFEAWEYGPVCRAVYDALKEYGSHPITQLIERRDPISGSIDTVKPPQNFLVKEHVNDVLKSVGHLSARQLVDLSHAPKGAWCEVWNKSKTSPIIGNRIHDKMSKERFVYLKISITDSPKEDIDEATPIAGD